MSFPGGATAAIILPFGGAIVLTLFFSMIYVRRYRNPRDSDMSTVITSVLSMAIAMLTSALLPIDIFIVSFMKNSDGTFKEWANATLRNNVEDAVLYSYYTLYSLIFFCIFIIIPFMYFYFEEKVEDGFMSSHSRFCSALKYTLIFLFVAVVLLLIGAFVPLREMPPNNSTEIERIKIFIHDITKNKGEDALSMVLSILSVIGMLNLLVYTGFGISSWPIGLIRGTKSAREQSEEIQDTHMINQTKIAALEDKERFGHNLTKRERRQLTQLRERERLISREENFLNHYRMSLYYKCRKFVRPLQIGFGAAAGALSLLIWISLLLTNIDKAMHSRGMRMGYELPEQSLPNPLDLVLVEFQKVFPLDYILILVIAFFLIMVTISGIRNIGLRFFGIRMYKLRPKRTPPQGLLMLCSTLMLTVLGINILFYCVSPQYTTFGNQYYIKDAQFANHTKIKCTTDASLDECTNTRASALLIRFFYKAWFFGAVYYWASWAFIGVSAFACVYVIIRQSRSATDGLLDSDDLEESDDEMIRA